MKRINNSLGYLLLMLGIAFAASSCDKVLDITPNDRYSEATAYANMKNLDLYTKSFYGVMMSPNTAEIRNTTTPMSDVMTDLMKPTFYNLTAVTDKAFYDPAIFIQSFPLDNWNDMYGRIKRINEFIVDYNNGLLNDLPKDEVAMRVGEARFWRAFAYQELIPRYGGVILRNSEEKVDDDSDRSKARSSVDESWDYVISEFKKAVELLPESWPKQELGRVTKGAAWGMIARSALYAGRWDEALKAVEEVDKLGTYALLDEYSEIYTKPHNKELLLAAYFERPNLQHKFDNFYGSSGDFPGHTTGVMATPTEEFAGTFEIKVNGAWKEFSWDMVNKEGIDPWKDRDPRFYSTILYNGAPWKHLTDAASKRWEPRNLELYVDGADGFHHFSLSDVTRSTVTGYVVRKYLQYSEESDFLTEVSDQYWIEMRYAEIILIKAEALARKGQFTQAYKELNKLRTTRPSVQLSEIPVKGSWNEFLDDLQKERIRELGLEGHRFWDLRRWGIAQKVMDGLVRHGVKITKSGDTFNYEYIEVDTKALSFPDRYMIHPIPLNEVRNNAILEQNPLWK